MSPESQSRNHILITGQPGVGKTTIITHLAEGLRDLHPSGFFTAEIRERGERKGFALMGLRGERGILAQVDFKSLYRVGKYGVDIKAFDEFLSSLHLSKESLIIIDEIGKMECLSQSFKKIITEILASESLLIATISAHGDGFIQEIKESPDVRIFEGTRENRDYLLEEIEREVRRDVIT